MSAIALRQAFGRAARVLGSRAQSTAAASLTSAPVPSNDPIMRPYYEELAKVEVIPADSPRELSTSERAVRRLPPPVPPVPLGRQPAAGIASSESSLHAHGGMLSGA